MLHIHQGGTQNTYCGRPLVTITRVWGEVFEIRAQVVAWEDAATATCFGCRESFGLRVGV